MNNNRLLDLLGGALMLLLLVGVIAAAGNSGWLVGCAGKPESRSSLKAIQARTPPWPDGSYSLAQALNEQADRRAEAQQWESALAAIPAAPGSPAAIRDSLQAEAVARAVIRQSAGRHRQLLARLDSLERRLARLEQRGPWELELRPALMPEYHPAPYYHRSDSLDRTLVQPFIRPGYVHP